MAEQQKIIQHEPLRVPQGWGEPGRSFIIQLERILTDIYRWLSRLTTVAEGAVTKNTNISGGTLTDAICRRSGNTVTASARLHTISPETTANGTFFIIPEGFRPAKAVKIMGYLVIESVFTPVMVTVNTDGKVSFAYSSVRTTSQAYFSGSWSVT